MGRQVDDVRKVAQDDLKTMDRIFGGAVVQKVGSGEQALAAG